MSQKRRSCHFTVVLLLLLITALLITGCRTKQEEAENVPDRTEKLSAAEEHSAESGKETESQGKPEEKSEESSEKTPQETENREELLVPEPSEEELVSILTYIPNLYVELKYATVDNYTGTVIYDFTEARLRYGTVIKLMTVQSELAQQGYSLKVWDAYRPISAQFTLWEVYPDPAFVANPTTGYSNHSKGNTLDVTLVLSDGTEVEMPTGFDDFSASADRDYGDVSEEAAANARLLENTMAAHGFDCYFGEWWHFSDTVSYPVIEE